MGTRTTYLLALAVILAALCALRIADPDPLVRLRLLAFDVFQRLAPRPVDPAFPVRIVDIDQTSISIHGRWPWPRATLGRLVSALDGLGAKVVAFDFVFPDPEPDPFTVFAEAVGNEPGARELLARLPRPPSGDAAFAEAIRGKSVVLGAIGRADAGPRILSPPTPFALLGSDPLRHVPTFATATLNVPALNTAAAGIGALNWLPESDQIVRKVPLVLRFGDELYPSLTAEALRLAEGGGTIAVRSATASAEGAGSIESGITSVRIGRHRIGTEPNGQVWVAFTPHSRQRYVSAASVLDGTAGAGDIAGRIVLVGTSAPGLFDLRATPLDRVIPGVEVHAQALEQMLQDRVLLRPDYLAGLEIALTVAGGIAIALSVLWFSAFAGVLLGGVVVAVVVAISWLGFSHGSMLIDPVFPVLGLTTVYVFGSGFLYFKTERERNRVRQAFSHYLEPSLVERLAREPERLRLGGETRELTVLFSDVRGFTGVAESYRERPTELIELMNRLLTPLTVAIIERHGTIDKYMGDAIMAFWNAPLDDPHHCRNATDSAIQMIDRLDRLNAERAAKAVDGAAPDEAAPLRLGIGIATGLAIVGNMGSQMRFDYSALGDAVNLASRLESLTAHYGVTNLLSDATCRAGAGHLAVLEIDVVRVKGRQRPERIWTVLGTRELADEPEIQAFAARFAEALALYRARDWAKAGEAFGQLAVQVRSERLGGPARAFATRCEDLLAEPPPPQWDGIWDAYK